MANIQERKGKDGKTTYRVQVRVKGCSTQYATFERKPDFMGFLRSGDPSPLETLQPVKCSA